MAVFCPLFSGSSGNSYYIGSADEGILVDAGRSAKQIREKLDACGIAQKAVHAIFVTHEHTDHIKGLRVLASRMEVPVYGSAGTLQALQKMSVLNGKFPAYVVGKEGVACAGMRIRPFHTSHDCAEGYGYCVETADAHQVAFATDLGYFSDEVRSSITGAELVVLESNHDVGMLQNGPYPYPLKRRILSDRGHLSNAACSEAVTGLVHSGTAHIFLAHLSKENNTPELARTTSLCALTQMGAQDGRDFLLEVAPRENPGKVTVF
ncbi:MAG: MBL fold metallo-hydrolase [Oscillospiraceae bacterium]|jgi:phosphoribosyl 1,2-cyclic phosphodiesterase|nr:MBL fold metallo-hydrolase [Oscillospiraceae bacterium]